MYLGMTLGVSSRNIKFWSPILDIIKTGLATWRCKLLSKASRLELIKFILNNLPIYYMTLFKLPNSVTKQIISIQRKFFWGNHDN